MSTINSFNDLQPELMKTLEDEFNFDLFDAPR